MVIDKLEIKRFRAERDSYWESVTPWYSPTNQVLDSTPFMYSRLSIINTIEELLRLSSNTSYIVSSEIKILTDILLDDNKNNNIKTAKNSIEIHLPIHNCLYHKLHNIFEKQILNLQLPDFGRKYIGFLWSYIGLKEPIDEREPKWSLNVIGTIPCDRFLKTLNKKDEYKKCLCPNQWTQVCSELLDIVKNNYNKKKH